MTEQTSIQWAKYSKASAKQVETIQKIANNETMKQSHQNGTNHQLGNSSNIKYQQRSFCCLQTRTKQQLPAMGKSHTWFNNGSIKYHHSCGCSLNQQLLSAEVCLGPYQISTVELLRGKTVNTQNCWCLDNYLLNNCLLQNYPLDDCHPDYFPPGKCPQEKLPLG